MHSSLIFKTSSSALPLQGAQIDQKGLENPDNLDYKTIITRLGPMIYYILGVLYVETQQKTPARSHGEK